MASARASSVIVEFMPQSYHAYSFKQAKGPLLRDGRGAWLSKPSARRLGAFGRGIWRVRIVRFWRSTSRFGPRLAALRSPQLRQRREALPPRRLHRMQTDPLPIENMPCAVLDATGILESSPSVYGWVRAKDTVGAFATNQLKAGFPIEGPIKVYNTRDTDGY